MLNDLIRIARLDIARIEGVLLRHLDAAPLVREMFRYTNPKDNRVVIQFSDIYLDRGYDRFKFDYLRSDDAMIREMWMLPSEFGTKDLTFSVLFHAVYDPAMGKGDFGWHTLQVERKW